MEDQNANLDIQDAQRDSKRTVSIDDATRESDRTLTTRDRSDELSELEHNMELERQTATHDADLGSIAGDAEKCIRLIDSARQAISADPKFPTWYEAHYERRLRFALSRHAVETRPFNTSVLAAMNGDRAIDRAVLAGAERLPRISAKIAALAWLTLRYRPTSLTRVAITSLLRYFERKVQT